MWFARGRADDGPGAGLNGVGLVGVRETMNRAFSAPDGVGGGEPGALPRAGMRDPFGVTAEDGFAAFAPFA